jgi:hypothetical protein
VALTVLALGAAVARAADKENKMVPEEGAIEVMLLRQASVREDLKLPAADAKKIHDFTKEQWNKAKQASKLPEPDRDRKFDELAKENHHFLDQTLTRTQRERLKEIELQIAGLLCLTRPEISKKLNLTSEQLKRVHEMQKEARRELEQLMYATKQESRHEKFAELRKTSRAKMLELLDDQQEKTWAQMQGKKFTGEFAIASDGTNATK